ncbi:hypothetical protein KY285_011841 [Solanum tuberosum]|nr:hypothetical protein KY284_034253 [Solanum tuberosum]KAH0736134.1 hypothetical protein KY285_011841 [Solanum tuberosum]
MMQIHVPRITIRYAIVPVEHFRVSVSTELRKPGQGFAWGSEMVFECRPRPGCRLGVPFTTRRIWYDLSNPLVDQMSQLTSLNHLYGSVLQPILHSTILHVHSPVHSGSAALQGGLIHLLPFAPLRTESKEEPGEIVVDRAPRGSPGRVSVPVWQIIRKDQLSIIGTINMDYLKLIQCWGRKVVLIISNSCISSLLRLQKFLIEKRRIDDAKVSIGKIRISGVEVELQDLTTLIERRQEAI